MVPQLILEKAPFFALAGGLSVVTLFAQRGTRNLAPLDVLPLSMRMSNALVSYTNYMGKLIWPQGFSVFYPHAGSLPFWTVFGSGLLLACLSIFTIRSASKKPWLAVGWFWYLGTLVPVIGLVQVGAQAMADRYTYMPLIGLFIMIVWSVSSPWPSRWAASYYASLTLSLSLGFWLTCLIPISWLQVRHWHNSVTLFEHALEVTPLNAVAHINLGIALADQGNFQQAITHYTEALRIEPNSFPNSSLAHYNFGLALASQEQLQEAIAHYTEALRIHPSFPEALTNLGIAFARQGKTEEAFSHFAEALRIKPDFPDAHTDLGIILISQGKMEEGISHYTEALRIEPNHAMANMNLYIAHRMMRKLAE